jgi:hypothetical protein
MSNHQARKALHHLEKQKELVFKLIFNFNFKFIIIILIYYFFMIIFYKLV